MVILTDNDVIGPVAALQRIIRSTEWIEIAKALQLSFATLSDFDLPRDASDQQVWIAAQEADAVLITANRSSGDSSLDRVIEALGQPTNLPVITLADPQRILREPSYAAATTLSLLDYIDRIESLRGVGRLYVP